MLKFLVIAVLAVIVANGVGYVNAVGGGGSADINGNAGGGGDTTAKALGATQYLVEMLTNKDVDVKELVKTEGGRTVLAALLRKKGITGVTAADLAGLKEDDFNGIKGILNTVTADDIDDLDLKPIIDEMKIGSQGGLTGGTLGATGDLTDKTLGLTSGVTDGTAGLTLESTRLTQSLVAGLTGGQLDVDKLLSSPDGSEFLSQFLLKKKAEGLGQYDLNAGQQRILNQLLLQYNAGDDLHNLSPKQKGSLNVLLKLVTLKDVIALNLTSKSLRSLAGLPGLGALGQTADQVDAINNLLKYLTDANFDISSLLSNPDGRNLVAAVLPRSSMNGDGLQSLDDEQKIQLKQFLKDQTRTNYNLNNILSSPEGRKYIDDIIWKIGLKGVYFANLNDDQQQRLSQILQSLTLQDLMGANLSGIDLSSLGLGSIGGMTGSLDIQGLLGQLNIGGVDVKTLLQSQAGQDFLTGILNSAGVTDLDITNLDALQTKEINDYLKKLDLQGLTKILQQPGLEGLDLSSLTGSVNLNGGDNTQQLLQMFQDPNFDVNTLLQTPGGRDFLASLTTNQGMKPDYLKSLDAKQIAALQQSILSTTGKTVDVASLLKKDEGRNALADYIEKTGITGDSYLNLNDNQKQSLTNRLQTLTPEDLQGVDLSSLDLSSLTGSVNLNGGDNTQQLLQMFQDPNFDVNTLLQTPGGRDFLASLTTNQGMKPDYLKSLDAKQIAALQQSILSTTGKTVDVASLLKKDEGRNALADYIEKTGITGDSYLNLNDKQKQGLTNQLQTLTPEDLQGVDLSNVDLGALTSGGGSGGGDVDASQVLDLLQSDNLDLDQLLQSKGGQDLVSDLLENKGITGVDVTQLDDTSKAILQGAVLKSLTLDDLQDLDLSNYGLGGLLGNGKAKGGFNVDAGN